MIWGKLNETKSTIEATLDAAASTLNISENGTYKVSSFNRVNVDVQPNLISATVMPTNFEQHITYTDPYDGLSEVIVRAIPSDYMGIGVIRNDASSIIVDGNTVTIPAGYYDQAITQALPEVVLPDTAANAGVGIPQATIDYVVGGYQYLNIPVGYNDTERYYILSGVPQGQVTAAPTIAGTSANITVGNDTITLSKTVYNTPWVANRGYVSSGRSGPSEVSLTAAVPTQAATVITPASTSQTAVAAGTYVAGNVTVEPVITQPLTVTPTDSQQVFNTEFKGSQIKTATFDSFGVSKAVSPNLTRGEQYWVVINYYTQPRQSRSVGDLVLASTVDQKFTCGASGGFIDEYTIVDTSSLTILSAAGDLYAAADVTVYNLNRVDGYAPVVVNAAPTTNKVLLCNATVDVTTPGVFPNAYVCQYGNDFLWLDKNDLPELIIVFNGTEYRCRYDSELHCYGAPFDPDTGMVDFNEYPFSYGTDRGDAYFATEQAGDYVVEIWAEMRYAHLAVTTFVTPLEVQIDQLYTTSRYTIPDGAVLDIPTIGGFANCYFYDPETYNTLSFSELVNCTFNRQRGMLVFDSATEASVVIDYDQNILR